MVDVDPFALRIPVDGELRTRDVDLERTRETNDQVEYFLCSTYAVVDPRSDEDSRAVAARFLRCVGGCPGQPASSSRRKSEPPPGDRRQR